MAGALSEMINTTMVHEFPSLAPRAKVHLVDHGQELLKMFADKGHAYTARVLEKDGVELRMGTGVTEIGPGHVTLSDGSTITHALRHLGRRPEAAPIAGASGLPQGRGGRIDVEPGLHGGRLPGRARDRRHREHPGQGRQDASAARLGRAAERWGGGRRRSSPICEGKQAKPFSYLDKGTMAMIGRGAAVAQVQGVELHGKVAFAAWLGVHAALMTGGSNRVDAFRSWAQDYFGKERAPQALDRSGTPRMTWERRRRGRDGGDGGSVRR